MRKLTVGTRGSALALTQTGMVIETLKSLYPGLDIDIEIIKTKGDKILDVPLAKIGDKGLFVKELEVALLERQVDFAVHSMKDLPTEMPDGLCLGAVPERVDPSDVLITNGPGLKDLPSGARIGSSSLRRRAQLHHYNPSFQISDLRGNLDTRLRKLDEGQYDAIILAFAGLCRMGWTERITEKIPLEVSLPAVGQGALAIQSRSDDDEVLSILSVMDHPETRTSVLAERSLMCVLEGGCQVPIGAHASVYDGQLTLRGVVASIDGSRLLRDQISSDPGNPEALGEELAQRLLAAGADEILAEVRSQTTEDTGFLPNKDKQD